MISYYELLEMIKRRNIPKHISLFMVHKKVKYVADYDPVDNSFLCYIIQNEEDKDENFGEYLRDCLLDNQSFEKCIIVEGKSSKIEKLDIRLEKNTKENYKWVICGQNHKYVISTPQKIIADKLNELIDIIDL